MKMEEKCSSETSVDFQRTTRNYITEDKNVHNNRCEDFKSYIMYFLVFRRLFDDAFNIETVCLLNEKWFGRKRSWQNCATIPAHARRYWRKPRINNLSQCSRLAGRDSNENDPERTSTAITCRSACSLIPITHNRYPHTQHYIQQLNVN
jgi:hypothetical protein